MPRGSGSSRRRGTKADMARETVGSRPADMALESVVSEEAVVIEPPGGPRTSAGTETKTDPSTPRFHIFIVDTGWDSPAHKVLQENFTLIRELQKEDPIYVLGKEKSIEYMRHHQERIGHDPIIAVHDLA